MKGHSTSMYGEKRSCSGRTTFRISRILQRLCLCSSTPHSPCPNSRSRSSVPHAKVTVRRPRRLRKRRPACLDTTIASNLPQSMLVISRCSYSNKNEIWSWDSCSTFEPPVEILGGHKEDIDIDDDDDDDSNQPESHLPELSISGETYPYDFILTNRLSAFVPHVLETIEEAEIECSPSLRERVETSRRSVSSFSLV